MVEARIGKDLEAGADSATLGVVGAVNEARDACLDHGAGAHATRLDGDVEGGAGEAVVAEEASGLAENDDFSVGGRVVVSDAAIAGTSENLAVVDKNCTDGDFAGGCRGAGFF